MDLTFAKWPHLLLAPPSEAYTFLGKMGKSSGKLDEFRGKMGKFSGKMGKFSSKVIL